MSACVIALQWVALIQIHNIYNPCSQVNLTAVPSGMCQDKEAIQVYCKEYCLCSRICQNYKHYARLAIRMHQPLCAWFFARIPSQWGGTSVERPINMMSVHTHFYREQKSFSILLVVLRDGHTCHKT